MRKLVFFLCFLLSSLPGQGQEKISREIEGIHLGKTLKVQAARILKSKGYHVTNQVWDFKAKPEEGPVTLNDTTIHLEQTWESEIFNSTADKKVYRFCFIQENKSEEEIDKAFSSVKLNLKKKYSQYTTSDTDYSVSYSDNDTEISLWKTTDTSLRLCYEALKIEDEE